MKKKKMTINNNHKEGPPPNIRADQIRWTLCSCGHIAQEHDVQGFCEERVRHCDSCTCSYEQMPKCSCEGFDGHIDERDVDAYEYYFGS